VNRRKIVRNIVARSCSEAKLAIAADAVHWEEELDEVLNLGSGSSEKEDDDHVYSLMPEVYESITFATVL
jgi:hypothetical protein